MAAQAAYVAPAVELLEVSVEKGFANSVNGGDIASELEEEDF
jgi:hypothetical protein